MSDEPVEGVAPPSDPTVSSSTGPALLHGIRWTTEHWAVLGAVAVFVGWLFASAYAHGIGVPVSALDFGLTEQLVLTLVAATVALASSTTSVWLVTSRQVVWYDRLLVLLALVLVLSAAIAPSIQWFLGFCVGLPLLLWVIDRNVPFVEAKYWQWELRRLLAKRAEQEKTLAEQKKMLAELKKALAEAREETAELVEGYEGLLRRADQLEEFARRSGIEVPTRPVIAGSQPDQVTDLSPDSQPDQVTDPSPAHRRAPFGVGLYAGLYVLVMVGLSVLSAYLAGNAVANNEPVAYSWRLVVQPVEGKLPTGECVTQLAARVYLHNEDSTVVIYREQPVQFLVDGCSTARP